LNGPEALSLRPWRAADASALQKYADNRKVWQTLRDLFPHPYTLEDAEAWIQRQSTVDPPTSLALVLGEEAIGNIGLVMGQDVNRFSAELGYWLGEPFWGQGLATEAVLRFRSFAFDTFALERLHAEVFSNNGASRRVLEKAGFVHEATLRRSVFKDGHFLDAWIFASWR
jgi:RimJ/RimL family protein N-acetyltransferase